MAIADRSGIPTVYQSTRFRSRLEARWAAFFDLIRWSWVYEPFDTGNWIPDFLIQGSFPFLVEVGPCLTQDEYRAKAEKAIAAFPPSGHTCNRKVRHVALGEECECSSFGLAPERTTLILGVSPLPIQGTTIAGWLTDDGDGNGWHQAVWNGCAICPRTVIRLRLGNVFGRFPCGHHTVDTSPGTQLNPELEQLWRRAGNDVQWPANGPQRVGHIIAQDLRRFDR